MPIKKNTYSSDDTYVALYRISTNTTRQSLSLPFQKESVHRFIDHYGGTIIKEFEEEVSGTSYNRLVFEEVVDLCQGTGSTLLVHKLSRLSRNGLSAAVYLEKRKVRFIEAIAPGDSEFVKIIKLAQAKAENDERKDNIKSALDQIKRNIKEKGFHIASKSGNKITKLGNPKNLTQAGRDKSIKTIKKKARGNPNNQRAIGVVELLILQELSLLKMAEYLTRHNFATSQGKEFTATAVSNLIRLYGKTREVPEKFKDKSKK